MSIRHLFGLLAVVALLVAACSSSASPVAPAADGAITIQDFSFSPTTLTVKPGTTITWTNNDSTVHTVTFDDGSASSGDIAVGATYQRTFATAGTFAYHCRIHPTMTGAIVVTP